MANNALVQPQKPISLLTLLARATIIALICVGILFGALSYFELLNNSRPQIKQKKTIEQAAIVNVLEANFVDIRPNILNYGQIISGRSYALSSQVSGRIVDVAANLKIGASVNKGDLLFNVDDFEYKGALLNAKAALEESKLKITDLNFKLASSLSELKLAMENLGIFQSDFERSKTLKSKGAITKKALEDAANKLSTQTQLIDNKQNSTQSLTNQITQLKTSLASKQWAVERALKNLKNTNVYAPFDAYIHKTSIELGQYINANNAVATLLDRKLLEVKFNLSDGQYGRIIAQDGSIIGRELKVEWQLGKTKTSFNAIVTRVNAEIIASSGGVEVIGAISDLGDVKSLRIGAFVKVLTPDQVYSNIISIPDYMLYENGVVYSVVNGSKATKIKPKRKKGGSKKQKPDENKSNNGAIKQAKETNQQPRLKAHKINVVGYDGENILIRNISDSPNKITNGDQLLKTRLSVVADGVLVITNAQAEKKRKAALKKLEQRAKDNKDNPNDEATKGKKRRASGAFGPSSGGGRRGGGR